MRNTVLSTLAVASLLGAGSLVWAQDSSTAGMKPIVTVAFSGYDEVLQDVGQIGKLAGNPQLSQMVEGLLNEATGGLAGLDNQKPWGLIVGIDETKLGAGGGPPGMPFGPGMLGAFQGYAFVPVADLKQLLGALAPTVGEPTDAGDGVLQIDAEGQTVYLKEQSGWAFVSISPEMLANTPADPVPLLDGLNESYDLAVRVTLANIPESLRQGVLGMVQMGVQMGAMPRPGETQEQAAIRAQVAEQTIEQMTALLNETEALSLGVAVDRDASTASFEYVLTAREGTPMAEQVARMSGSTTDYAGFLLDGAAMTMNASAKLGEKDIARTKTMLAQFHTNALADLDKQGLPDAASQQAKKMIGDLFAVIEATVDGGRLDGGMALVLDPDAVTLVAGSLVADSAKLEALVKDLVDQLVREQPDAAGLIEFDAEEHQGVQFHTLSLSIAPTAMMGPQADTLSALVGDKLDVVVGIGPQSVYFAAGRDAAQTLKGAIDQSKAEAGKSVPPMQLALAATPIAKFVGQVGPDEAKVQAGMLAAMLQDAGGKDRITITSTAVPNGIKVRLEVEEGLLKLIGSLPTLMMGMGGPGGPGF